MAEQGDGRGLRRSQVQYDGPLALLHPLYERAEQGSVQQFRIDGLAGAGGVVSRAGHIKVPEVRPYVLAWGASSEALFGAVTGESPLAFEAEAVLTE